MWLEASFVFGIVSRSALSLRIQVSNCLECSVSVFLSSKIFFWLFVIAMSSQNGEPIDESPDRKGSGECAAVSTAGDCLSKAARMGALRDTRRLVYIPV